MFLYLHNMVNRFPMHLLAGLYTVCFEVRFWSLRRFQEEKNRETINASVNTFELWGLFKQYILYCIKKNYFSSFLQVNTAVSSFDVIRLTAFREFVILRNTLLTLRIKSRVSSVKANGTYSNRPNIKVGYTSSTQGILRVVVTGNFSFYQLDYNKDICDLESLVFFLTQSLNSYTLLFTFNLLVYSTVTNWTNQCTSLLSHLFPFNLLTRASAKKSLTQPVLASRPLTLSSLTAGWLLYTERDIECPVPREAKRQYRWNPS